MKIIFWFSFGVLFYTYAGYPLLMMMWSRMRQKKSVREIIYPSITVVIAAHDEQEMIEERLENIFSQDYPAQKLDVVVDSDGSTDNTIAILDKLKQTRLNIIEPKDNKGKAVALNY